MTATSTKRNACNDATYFVHIQSYSCNVKKNIENNLTGQLHTQS